MDTDSTTLFVSSCLLTLRRSRRLQGRYATSRACVTLLPFSEHTERVRHESRIMHHCTTNECRASNRKIKIEFPCENKYLQSTTRSKLTTQPNNQQHGRNTPLRCFQAVRCLRIRLRRDWWWNWHWLDVLASSCSQRSQGTRISLILI